MDTHEMVTARPGKGAVRHEDPVKPNGTQAETPAGNGAGLHVAARAEHTESHVVTYGGDGHTGSASFEPPQYAPADTVSGQVEPQPPAGQPSITVCQEWQKYKIDVERSLLKDVLAAIQGAASGLTAAGLDSLPTALDKVIDAVQPLFDGKKLIYTDDWKFGFNCSGTIDGKPDNNAQFAVSHSITYNAGVTTPGADAKIHWKLQTTPQVGTEVKDFTASDTSAEPDGGTDFKTRSHVTKFKAVGIGHHVARESIVLELDVDGYGSDVAKLIEDVKQEVSDLKSLVDQITKALKGDSSVVDTLKAFLGIAKSGLLSELDQLKTVLRKTRCSIEVKTSVFEITYVPPAAAPQAGK